MIAVLSDVHANLTALEAVLADAERNGAEEIWFLGDAVGYGARPDQVCRLLSTTASRALAGNHDLGVVEPTPARLAPFRSDYLAVLEWTLKQLSEPALEWLQELEPTDLDDAAALYHGSPRDPLWEYVMDRETRLAAWEQSDATLILLGHSHYPFAYPNRLIDGRFRDQHRDGEWLELGDDRWLINPGSVGQPRDGDWRAAYALLDQAQGRLAHRRVEYDVDQAAAEIVAAGLPEPYAQRLAYGI